MSMTVHSMTTTRTYELADDLSRQCRCGPDTACSKCEAADFIRKLSRRISELEDGACRFNCRKEREAFQAGYDYALAGYFQTCREAYSAWLKERDDG